MKESITSKDKYPLDLSQTYVHKSVCGAIFTIFYTLISLCATIGLIFRHFLHPNTTSIEQVVGFDEQLLRPDYNSMYINGTITVTNINSAQLKEVMQYLTITLLTSSSDINGVNIDILHYDIDEVNNKVNFNVNFKDEYFNGFILDYPRLSLQTCQSINEYNKYAQLNIIDKNNYLSTCNNNTNVLYQYDYLQNALFLLSFQMPDHLILPDLSIEPKLKTYDIQFKLNTFNRLYFTSKLVKRIVSRVKGIIPRTTQTILGSWKYPQRSDVNAISSAVKEFYLFIAFDSSDDDSMYFYATSRYSLISVAIDIGSVFKVLELLSFIPYLWNVYYIQRAFMSLVNYYKGYDNEQHAFPLLEGNETEISRNEGNKQGNELLIGSINQMSYCKWVCVTCCCCCSKNMRNEHKWKKNKLMSLEKTVFIKFDADDKWVDFKRYLQ